jgi:tocopherol cyclase
MPHDLMPHSGYHWRNQPDRFFEGWYFRLTLPDLGQTFAFMYSIDDPAGGCEHSGGAAQILGPNEAYYCRTFPNVAQFWAWPHRLGLGHWRANAAQQSARQSARYLAPDRFDSVVEEGYQVSDRLHQGKLLDPTTGQLKARWHYETIPLSSWGAPTARATAGWLSYLPIFEPGWQVLMAHGLATGWIDWQGHEADKGTAPTRYTFKDAPAYAEKNWGGAFPAKWFWIQCNAFADEPTLSVTAVAGVREVLILKENVGLIGIHHQGQFYEFLSTKTDFTWQVEPWGYWQVTARSYSHRVVITGRAHDEGAWVRVPTREGLQFFCRDTTHGELHIQLWDCLGVKGDGDSFGRLRHREASSREAFQGNRLILEATSQLAGLEVGGGPWDERWVNG